MRPIEALESHRTQGDCRGGYKTILKYCKVSYSPAEEDIRLRGYFPSSAEYINMTKLYLNKEMPLGALYRHTLATNNT